MKILLSTLFLFALSTHFSIAQSFTTYKWQNGKPKAEGNLIQGGIEDGEWKFYNKSGQLIQLVNFKFGEFHGPYKHFTENGELAEEGSFIDAKRDGLFTTYYPNGKVELTGYYKIGYKDSLWTFNYADGNKKREGWYEIDQRKGQWKEWHPNGQIKMLISYTDDEQLIESFFDEVGKQLILNGSGVWTIYHSNGKTKESGRYDGGKREGRWERWNSEGVLISVETFKNNQPNGDWVTFFPNGNKKSEGQYKEGLKSGPWRHYFISGQLNREETFNEGHKDGLTTTYFKEGKIAELSLIHI